MYQIRKILGARIKFFRNSQGFTQEYFAEKIGISPRSVSFIENGKTYPSPETLALICNALSVEPYKLFLVEKEFNIISIKKFLIDKINNDDNFAMLVYTNVK